MLERASIAGGATVAVVLVVIISIIFYTYVRQQRKEQRLRYAPQLTTVSLQYLTFFFLFSRSSFEQVTVDKIQIRSRSFSSCNSFGGCRFGGASTGNDSLHHQQRLQFNLPVGYKKVSHPNLTSVEAHYAHVHHLAALSSNPVNKTETPINILVNLFPFN